jgi:hypothetical protein
MIIVIGMKPTNKIFMNIDGDGTFILEDCIIEMSKTFYSWGSEGNSWNGTFININKGKINFENDEFNNIEVSESNTLFLSNSIYEKEINITNCIFKNCGSIKKDSKMISLSSSVNSGTLCTISNTHFISCFGDGECGCIYINNVKTSINNCEFLNCSGSGRGGLILFYIIFIFILLYIYIYMNMHIQNKNKIIII